MSDGAYLDAASSEPLHPAARAVLDADLELDCRGLCPLPVIRLTQRIAEVPRYRVRRCG